jgi:hypothetical protein
MLHGDPGAAKSTLEELVRTLVDPSSVLTFALPKDIFELVQQLDHNHIAYYDNVSRIPDWISDQFCRASTGAGSSKRRLYTDDDDKIYNFKRCVGFNGINLAATKSDLLDRGLIIRVERIDDKVKQKKEKIWQEFEKLRPQLLGYIFDVLVKVLGMRQTTSVEFEKLPRMADFAEVAEIISRCMGNKDNQFIDAYYENIKLQTEEILETSLVASAILKFMHDRKEWNGNATELLEQLDQAVSQKTLKNKFWPKASNVLSRRMNETKTNLREIGIFIEEGQADPITRVKTIVIKKTTDIGKISFGSLESFDDHNKGESSNNTSNFDKTPQNRSLNDMNDMNDIYRNPTDPMPPNTLSIASDNLEAIFWQRFKKLEDSSQTVKGEELKASLVSSGKFYQSDAALFVEEMLRTGKIGTVSYDVYRAKK